MVGAMVGDGVGGRVSVLESTCFVTLTVTDTVLVVTTTALAIACSDATSTPASFAFL